VVGVPGYRTEMYCDSSEVRTEFVYVVWRKVDRLCGLMVGVPGYRSRGSGSIPSLPDIVRGGGSGAGSAQPRGCNWGAA
jgi:hypothetical protein